MFKEINQLTFTPRIASSFDYCQITGSKIYPGYRCYTCAELDNELFSANTIEGWFSLNKPKPKPLSRESFIVYDKQTIYLFLKRIHKMIEFNLIKKTEGHKPSVEKFKISTNKGIILRFMKARWSGFCSITGKYLEPGVMMYHAQAFPGIIFETSAIETFLAFAGLSNNKEVNLDSLRRIKLKGDNLVSFKNYIDSKNSNPHISCEPDLDSLFKLNGAIRHSDITTSTIVGSVFNSDFNIQFYMEENMSQFSDSVETIKNLKEYFNQQHENLFKISADYENCKLVLDSKDKISEKFHIEIIINSGSGSYSHLIEMNTATKEVLIDLPNLEVNKTIYNYVMSAYLGLNQDNFEPLVEELSLYKFNGLIIYYDSDDSFRFGDLKSILSNCRFPNKVNL